MAVTDLLDRDREAILDEAAEALQRSRLRHYGSEGAAWSRQRLAILYDLMIDSIRERNLVPVIEYVEEMATRRFEAGYPIGEVQTAINVLEESTWRHIVGELTAAELAEAIGLVSTVLGTAKDTLARRYVALASEQKVPSLDLTALFRGSGGS